VDDEDSSYLDGGVPAPDRLYDWDDRWSAPRRTVVFWPRAATATWASVQYLATPRRMVLDTDVPAMPDTYHPYLVHRVVAEFARRAGNKERAESEDEKADAIYARMLSREIATYEKRTREPWRSRQGVRTLPRTTITFTG
jgi:hypothetical protein